MKSLVIYFLFFYVNILYTSEYIYPVAFLCNGEIILYIHQHNLKHLELCEWNTKTNYIQPILWSQFTPANFLLLPDNSGFSFIDNGRLRIKLFQKRSPKAIDFDEPIITINSLTWINAQTCYCSAQQNNNFGLFQLQDNGTIKCLIAKNNRDYLYPQKINDYVFCIKRSIDQGISKIINYKIMKYLYNKNNSLKGAELIIDCGNTPLIFLKMISDQEGFVLEYTQNIDSDNPTIVFSYHHLIQEDNIWHKNIIFYFQIPTHLLLENKDQLYESLLPLLPQIVDNKVYFVDCSKNHNNYLEVFFYDISTKAIEQIALPEKNGHYFVPLLCGKKFYCGGTLDVTQKIPLFCF